MDEETALAAALRRLDQALGALDAAAAVIVDSEDVRSARGEEAAMLAADRARLADELDTVSARAAALERVNAEVSRRLDGAMETIRTVLATHGA